jgi:peroxiredoxin
MKYFSNTVLALVAVLFLISAPSVFAKVASRSSTVSLTIGAPAPALNFTDAKGNVHNFEHFKGKVVVLEWTNHQCPFVRRQYDGGAMQALQKKYTDEGVVWLSVVSSAPGNEGYVTGDEAEKVASDNKAVPTAIVLDPSGELGKAFGAKTTPHMFILGKDGTLVYKGAVDNIRSFRPEDVKNPENYFANALDEVLAGKPVSKPDTLAYGCSVKYDK